MKTLFSILLLTVSAFAAAAEQATITVTDAVVRGMPPGRTVTAAFFEVSNTGESDCKLVSAETDIAKRTELHTHLHEDGVMKMRELPSVVLPAGQSVSFKPGGLHIMLFDTRPLKDGESVQMSLRFKDCADVVVDAAVRSVRR